MVAKYSDSRSPSAMSVINKAEELAVYILRVCGNENNETLQKYGILIDAIRESCLTVAMYTAQAIAIPLTSKESYRFAREIQRYITAELAALEELFVIAIRLYAFKNSSYVSALYTNLAGAFTLWIRNLNRQFSRFMSKQAEKEKKKAIEYHREKSPGLTLAFSLLHDRSWILIYRFGDDYVEYLHIDKYTFDENVIKRLIIPEKAKDDGQLMLSLRPERKRERRKEEAITQDQ